MRRPRQALATREPLDVVNASLIPALDVVGDGFRERNHLSAAAAPGGHRGPGSLRGGQGERSPPRASRRPPARGKIVVATVKGDVHDIGKNIVRVILENYGYDVLDLGRDVPPERVVEAVRTTGATAGGALGPDDHHRAQYEGNHRRACTRPNLPCQVWVGGAVLTPGYAKEIGADFYCKDAKASADLAKQISAETVHREK